MNKLKSALTFFIISSFICFVLFWLILGLKDKAKTYVADEYTKAKHKYHGTEMSYECRGKYYFERNGKKVRL